MRGCSSSSGTLNTWYSSKTTHGTAAYYKIRETNTRLSGSSKLLYHGDKVATRNLLVFRQVKGDGDTELWYPPAGKTSIPKLTLFYI